MQMLEDFRIYILGCGSALPTTRHLSSSQTVFLRDKLYLVDCGEGAQWQMRRMKLKLNRLNHIFISHMHGDHCFGLPGLISTLGMLGRTADLFIYGVPELEAYIGSILELFNAGLGFKVRFTPVDPLKHELIMEDRSLNVYSIPLRHRVPSCGFLFEEKPKEARLIREAADFHQVPLHLFRQIKQGADFVTPEGRVIPNSALTSPPPRQRKYAYCSDTAFAPDIVPIIKGVDLLYHETTFAKADAARADETGHSTSVQAAEIARMANVGQLVAGHFSARYEDEQILLREATEIFPNTILSSEGMAIPVLAKS